MSFWSYVEESKIIRVARWCILLVGVVYSVLGHRALKRLEHEQQKQREEEKKKEENDVDSFYSVANSDDNIFATETYPNDITARKGTKDVIVNPNTTVNHDDPKNTTITQEYYEGEYNVDREESTTNFKEDVVMQKTSADPEKDVITADVRETSVILKKNFSMGEYENTSAEPKDGEAISDWKNTSNDPKEEKVFNKWKQFTEFD